jgi:hypothetical protein
MLDIGGVSSERQDIRLKFRYQARRGPAASPSEISSVPFLEKRIR